MNIKARKAKKQVSVVSASKHDVISLTDFLSDCTTSCFEALTHISESVL